MKQLTLSIRSPGVLFAGIFGLVIAGGARTSIAAEVIVDETILEAPILEIHSIANDAGDSRILLRPSDLTPIDGEFVVSATLQIPLSGAVSTKNFNIVMQALDRDWSSTATWTSPWEKPGGDVFEDYVVVATISEGATDELLEVDVSEMVRAMADGEVAKNGFLLMSSMAEEGGFKSDELQAIGSLEGAKLFVDYRKISELGFPKEGSRALWKRSLAVDED